MQFEERIKNVTTHLMVITNLVLSDTVVFQVAQQRALDSEDVWDRKLPEKGTSSRAFIATSETTVFVVKPDIILADSRGQNSETSNI